MDHANHTARIAALWMVHGNALARLLRNHGKMDHAENLDAALGEVAEILCGEVGRTNLSEAMDWATDQIWNHGDALGPAATRN